MKLSRRAKRMELHHSRNKSKSAVLNMVSLMDIFTILVFFLLVNATSSEILPSQKNILLPDSTSEKLPQQNLVISVDKHYIRLQGKPIISVEDALKTSQTISPLYTALKTTRGSVKNIADNKGVTIMGDKQIPYQLLKKIMLTCAGAEYTNISFAVNQIMKQAEG
ncbi:MAG: biopolymer transporter ExbD [Gammaproteobacteria bacterium]|nr:biopolymer transporter ExbD [Gammaproteobacteria bacterium]